MTDIKHNMAIGFVTYYPTDEFYKRIELVSSARFEIYIFDNSPDATRSKKVADAIKNVKYITGGKNLGLGVGLSIISGTAFSDAYPMLLFFDQDTNFTVNTLDYIYKFACENSSSFRKDYALVVFSALKSSVNAEYNVQEVLLAISSGSLFFLDNLERIGGHNESYFVDGVDYEICLRARMNRLKVGMCGGTPGFDHVSEQPDRELSIFNKSMPIRRYSIKRILDAIGAYIKLIFSSIRSRDFLFAGVMIRSITIYLFGQILSRIVLKKVS